jgi:hypothetical protein
MTLAQFALAVGADPKWVQNATAALQRYLRYTEDEARIVGLARLIHSTAGTSLRSAYDMAEAALSLDPPASTIVAESPDGSVRVVVDVWRYLCTFTAWLSRARTHEPARRGRPAVREPWARWSAEGYGLDVSLIDANMERSLEERIHEADEIAEVMTRYRIPGL